MKALLFPGDRVVELADVPEPQALPGWAVLRITASGICGTDLHKYREPAADRAAFARRVGGHEPVGVVHSVGDGVDPALVGTRVVGWHIWGCLDPSGPCTAAVASGGMFCPHAAVHGRNVDGSNAEYYVAPGDTLLPLPDTVSDADGVLLACNVGTAWSALRKAGPLDGALVGVWGLGPVGLACVLLAASQGARVVCVDLSPQRRAAAWELGAAEVLDAGGAGPRHDTLDVAVDTTGLRAVQSRLPVLVRHAGQVLLIGLGQGTGLERTNLVTLKELAVRGSLVYHRRDWDDLLAAAAAVDGGIGRLISDRRSWRDASTAFADADAGRTAKVVFDWTGS